MTLRIATKDLVGLLTDLLQTAGDDPDLPMLNGVLVHTCRGHWGSEPGEVDLLAGVSTNRFVAGHSYTYAAGQLGDGPMWWDRLDILAVLAVLKPLSKKPDHAIELRISDQSVDGDDQAHRFVVVEEDKDLFGDGVSVQFPARDGADFPGQSVYRQLAGRPSGDWTAESGARIDALRRSDLSSVHLQPFLTVGKRRGGELLRVYRAHQNQVHHVQIGDTYLGMLMPARYGYEQDGDSPSAELYAPAWPETPGEPDVDGDGVLIPNVDESQSGRPDPAQTSTDDVPADADA